MRIIIISISIYNILFLFAGCNFTSENKNSSNYFTSKRFEDFVNHDSLYLQLKPFNGFNPNNFPVIQNTYPVSGDSVVYPLIKYSSERYSFDILTYGVSHLKDDHFSSRILTIDKNSDKAISQVCLPPDFKFDNLTIDSSENLIINLIFGADEYDETIKSEIFKIYERDIKINPDGISEFGTSQYLDLYTFFALPITLPYTGEYIYENDSTSLKLFVRDGLQTDHYAYYIKFYTPDGCVITLQNWTGQPLSNENEMIIKFVEENKIDENKYIIAKFTSFDNVYFTNRNILEGCDSTLNFDFDLKRIE